MFMVNDDFDFSAYEKAVSDQPLYPVTELWKELQGYIPGLQPLQQKGSR